MVNNFFQLINIVLVLGFPATFGVVLGVTRNPILATISTGIYAVIAVALAVGQRMNERFVEDAGDYLYNMVSAPFRSHHDRYIQYLEDRYTFLNLKGTGDRGTYDPELHEVFVNLRVVEIDDTSNSRRNLILDQTTSGEMYDIWHFVKQPEYQHLAILGPPGSGKTTIMQHIVMTLVTPHLRRKVKIPRKMPIFLFLREHASAIKENPEITVIELVNKRLENMVSKLHPDWIQRQLLNGNCLVLLDGLDEVSEDETRNAVSKWVKSQIENYPDNYFYISSRPGGYNHDIFRGSGIHVIDVQTFNREQQESFIYKWYLVNESGHKKLDIKDSKVVFAAQEGKDLFFRQVQRVSALADMASNPLLLTLMAILHSRVGSIPQKRSELYKQIFDVLLQKRQQAKGIPDDKLSNAQKLQVLKPLAFYIMQRSRGVDISVTEAEKEVGEILRRVDSSVGMSDFLKTIYHGSGLMNPHQVENLYRFSHKTFMEYLTAMYINENLQQSHLLLTLISDIGNEWWHETIRLYCTMSDATPVIEACIEAINPDAEDLDFAPLIIGIECLTERASVDPVIEDAFLQKVNKGMESVKEIHARYFREGRLKLRINDMIPVDDTIAVSSDSVTNAEYALFLQDSPIYRDFCMPVNWQNGHFASGTGNLPVKGIDPLAGTLFCIWLSRRDQQRYYRIPGQKDLKYLKGVSANVLTIDRFGAGGTANFENIAREIIQSPSQHSTKLFNLGVKIDNIDFNNNNLVMIIENFLATNTDGINFSQVDYAHAHVLNEELNEAIQSSDYFEYNIYQALNNNVSLSVALNSATQIADAIKRIPSVSVLTNVSGNYNYNARASRARDKRIQLAMQEQKAFKDSINFIYMCISKLLTEILVEKFNNRENSYHRSTERMRVYTLYYIIQVLLSLEKPDGEIEYKIARYQIALRAMHTATLIPNSEFELTSNNLNNEMILISEYYAENSNEKVD